MPTENPFTDIRLKAGSTEKSLRWYRTQVRRLTPSASDASSLLRNGTSMTTQILPGSMYLFHYDAKYKNILPMWDMFPLVIPFKRESDGFYGFNLHYLSYAMRFRMLGALHNFATDDKMDEKTRVYLSWKLVNSTTKLEPLRDCVKHYLFKQVKSRAFMKINYPDWVVASQLPVEKFIYR